MSVRPLSYALSFQPNFDNFFPGTDVCFLKATLIREGSQAVPGRVQKLGQIPSGAVLGASYSAKTESGEYGRPLWTEWRRLEWGEGY